MDPRILDAVGLIAHFVTDQGNFTVNRFEISEELRSHGYTTREIKDAFIWIEDKTLGKDASERGLYAQEAPNRILSPVERSHIGVEAYGFLVQLRSRGIIDTALMEEIIEYCVLSEREEISATEMRQIAALCIFRGLQRDWRDFLRDCYNASH